GPRARLGRARDQSGPHGEQGPRAPARGPLLGVGAGADRDPATPPRAEGAARHRRPALPDQGRDQRPVLRDAPDEATPRIGQHIPWGAVRGGGGGRVLQLWRRYGDCLEVGALPRADPLAARDVGPTIAGPGGQGEVTVGMAVLPPGEDRQELLPADES